MALSDIDRNLLSRCLANKPNAWRDFVDRYMGLVVHVVNNTAANRSIRLSNADREDLVAEVFLGLIDRDYAVFRQFRGQSSFATYLTVVARRIVVRALLAGGSAQSLGDLARDAAGDGSPEQRISDREEVERLIGGLGESEAVVVRMYHLEGKSYDEISHQTGMPANSIGPLLSRARGKMRLKADPAAG